MASFGVWLLGYLHGMFEWLLREYPSRAEVMDHDPSLIYATTVGDIFISIACFLIGFLMLKYRIKRNNPTLIYLPLGVFFITIALAHVSLIFCMYRGFYWINALIKDFAGVAALWTLAYLPRAIKERRESIRAMEVLRREAKEIEKLKEKIDGNITNADQTT